MYNDGRWAPSTLPDEHSAVQCTYLIRLHSGGMGRNFSKKICEIFWFQNDRQVLNYPIKHILYFFDARKALELTFFEQGWTFMQ